MEPGEHDKPLRLAASEHKITPRLRTIHTMMTGAPVSGLDPRNYPLLALCLECGEQIRIVNFLGDWRHC